MRIMRAMASLQMLILSCSFVSAPRMCHSSVLVISYPMPQISQEKCYINTDPFLHCIYTVERLLVSVQCKNGVSIYIAFFLCTSEEGRGSLLLCCLTQKVKGLRWLCESCTQRDCNTSLQYS